MKTIAIANRKGGVGKSTTAAALTAGLSLKGFRVLAIDLDAQRNLSTTFRERTDSRTVNGVLLREITAADAIRHTASGDIIPASKDLADSDLKITATGKEYRLREALGTISAQYDYCVIDCPPALGILTVNALTAADTVIIPAQADAYSLDGIEDLQDIIKDIKTYCNHNLTVEGILLTRYQGRAVLSRDVTTLAGQLAERLGTRLFDTRIRESITVKEAQISQQSLFEYAPRAQVTEDYRQFIEELLRQ